MCEEEEEEEEEEAEEEEEEEDKSELPKLSAMGEIVRRLELWCWSLLAESMEPAESSLPAEKGMEVLEDGAARAHAARAAERARRSARTLSMVRLKVSSPPESVTMEPLVGRPPITPEEKEEEELLAGVAVVLVMIGGEPE